MKGLHQRLNLYADSNETYIFVPVEPIGARSLVIYRNSGGIVLKPPNTPLPPTAERSGKTIYGILGMVSLVASDYIIIITGRELKGQIMGHNIYRVSDFDILPLNPDVSITNPPNAVEAHLLALVRSHLYAGHFLLSYTWDLTRRLQAQWATHKQDEGKAMWEVADDRFFWNKYLQSKLIDHTLSKPDQNLSPFILPLMYGTFDIRPARINGQDVKLCLISRRCRYRAGTRYFRRGIDHEGNVANFNETEQILLVETYKWAKHGEESSVQLSFVQIRGSVPLFWSEVNNLRYKPELVVMNLQDALDATKRHFEKQTATYGEQSLVNLVNHHGHERPIKDAFERHITELNLPNVRYEYFDFHNECKHLRWDRISVLIEKVEPDLLKYGYFHLDSSTPEPVKLQTGIVRTNCMDNLDRTNVAQAAIAKWALNRQLKALGILKENDTLDNYEEISQDFREMWSDHANLISLAYAGTGALKTEYTRTGKLTKMGQLEDGYKSVIRYLRNNFFDGARQDAFDLMTGAWVPKRNWSPSKLVVDRRPLVIRAMPYLLWFSVFMILAGLTLPRSSDYNLLYYFLFWFALVALSSIFIFSHGIEYVNWPRLIPLDEVINYDGPGFRAAWKGRGFGIPALDKKVKALRMNHRKLNSRIDEIEMGSKIRVD